MVKPPPYTSRTRTSTQTKGRTSPLPELTIDLRAEVREAVERLRRELDQRVRTLELELRVRILEVQVQILEARLDNGHGGAPTT